MDNNNMWDDVSFRNCSLSIDRTENQTSFDSDISNSSNKWSMFKIRKTHFIDLKVNCFL